MTVILAALVLAAGVPDQPLVVAGPVTIGAGHRGHCQTARCTRRMRARVHRETVKKWKNVARPYAGWLRSTRMCESGGNYRTNTGNGFYGAYQFTLSSWYSVGGRRMPHAAEPAEQDYRAVRLLHVQGRGAWPVCGYAG